MITSDFDVIKKGAVKCGTEMHISLFYPGLSVSTIKSFVIGLCDVRAADEIRVSYDYERDGWKIEQSDENAESFQETGEPDWVEVAFVKSWGRETKKSDEL